MQIISYNTFLYSLINTGFQQHHILPPLHSSFHCVPETFLNPFPSLLPCMCCKFCLQHFLDLPLVLHTSTSFIPNFIYSFHPYSICFVLLSHAFALSLGHLNIAHPSLDLPLADFTASSILLSVTHSHSLSFGPPTILSLTSSFSCLQWIRILGTQLQFL